MDSPRLGAKALMSSQAILLWEVGSVIIPSVLLMELAFREAKKCAQGHSASK